MIISTSRDDKQIFLWDERTGGIVFSYEDESVKTYIPRTKINVLGIYSDYIIATQENKSMFLVWKTDTVDAIFKSSPIEERITVFKPSRDSLYFFIGTEFGKVYIYELFSGNILTSFQAHLESINDLEINYDGSVLITCSHDNLIRVFLIERYIPYN
jgi:WD40 repeat protein